MRSFVFPRACESVCICPTNHTTYTIHNESPLLAHDASFVFICVCLIEFAAPWFQPYFNFLSQLLIGCPQISALASANLYGVNTRLQLHDMTEGLAQRCTNSGHQINRATKFLTVGTNICKCEAWKLYHVAVLAPRILRCLLNFQKIFRHVIYCVFHVKTLGNVNTLYSSATLAEVFRCFYLSCKANARVKLAKTGHGQHSSRFVSCVVLFVSCVVLFVRCVVLFVICVVLL